MSLILKDSTAPLPPQFWPACVWAWPRSAATSSITAPTDLPLLWTCWRTAGFAGKRVVEGVGEGMREYQEGVGVVALGSATLINHGPTDLLLL